MARIIYGVSGEGSGHATRSKEILSRLVKKHKVKVLVYGKSYEFLKNFFDVVKIYGLHLYYKKGSVDYLKTVLGNLKRLPNELGATRSVAHDLIRDFSPEIVISDFEPVSGMIARFKKLPLISLDNQHIFTNCDVRYPKKFAKEAIINKLVIKSYLPKINETLITCFYHPRIIKKNTYLFHPIVREKILKQMPLKGKHVLVYQTASGDDSIIKILNRCKQKFVFYGCNRDIVIRNVRLKKFSENGFIRDLASCSFVITNGGLSLISEALYLGKPVLSVPIAGQVEQIANAYYLNKIGYGRYCRQLTFASVERFYREIASYERNLKNYPRTDCSTLVAKLEELISKHVKQQKLQ